MHTSHRRALLTVPALSVTAVLILLIGCGGPKRTVAPTAIFPDQKLGRPHRYIQDLQSRYGSGPDREDVFTKYAAAPDKTAYRNKVVSELMLLVDHNYDDFRYRISGGKSVVDTAFDITSLGLTSAATITNGVQAKTVLAGLATAVTGTKLAIDKNVFAETATYVLIAHMDGRRELVRAQLNASLKQSDVTYPLPMAIGDLYRYYQAGTLPEALKESTKQAIQTSTQANDAALVATIVSLANEDKPQATAQAQGLRRLLAPPGEALLTNIINEGGVPNLRATTAPAAVPER